MEPARGCRPLRQTGDPVRRLPFPGGRRAGPRQGKKLSLVVAGDGRRTLIRQDLGKSARQDRRRRPPSILRTSYPANRGSPSNSCRPAPRKVNCVHNAQHGSQSAGSTHAWENLRPSNMKQSNGPRSQRHRTPSQQKPGQSLTGRPAVVNSRPLAVKNGISRRSQKRLPNPVLRENGASTHTPKGPFVRQSAPRSFAPIRS
jgi:hypothetical protein